MSLVYAVSASIGRLAALALILIITAHSGMAQTTFASITGTVTDPQGSFVPKVQIEATHVASNYRYTAESNEQGNYTLANLREGEYTLRATAPGFNAFEVKDIKLVTRDIRRIDINLTVGTVQTTMEINAGAT